MSLCRIVPPRSRQLLHGLISHGARGTNNETQQKLAKFHPLFSIAINIVLGSFLWKNYKVSLIPFGAANLNGIPGSTSWGTDPARHRFLMKNSIIVELHEVEAPISNKNAILSDRVSK